MTLIVDGCVVPKCPKCPGSNTFRNSYRFCRDCRVTATNSRFIDAKGLSSNGSISTIDISATYADVIVTNHDHVLVDFVILASSSRGCLNGLNSISYLVGEGGGERDVCRRPPRSDPPPSATQV
jgi:hypothetical protein